MAVQFTLEADSGQVSHLELSEMPHLDEVGSDAVDSSRRPERIGRRRFGTRGVMDPSDVALMVEAAKEGNQDAWNALVERFASTVWAIARGFRLRRRILRDAWATLVLQRR